MNDATKNPHASWTRPAKLWSAICAMTRNGQEVTEESAREMACLRFDIDRWEIDAMVDHMLDAGIVRSTLIDIGGAHVAGLVGGI